MVKFLKSLFCSTPIIMSEKEKEDTIRVLRESINRSKSLIEKYENAIQKEIGYEIKFTTDIDNFSKKIDKHDLRIVQLEKEIIRIKNL